MMFRPLPVLLVALSVVFAGCRPAAGSDLAPTAGDAAPAAKCSIPRRVVVGLDRSGSYALARTGIDHMATLFEREACPSDVWMLRWVEENSFAPGAAITTIALPPLSPQPTPPSGLAGRRGWEHPQAQRQWEALANAFATARAQAANDIRGLAPPAATESDIFGFLAKAAQLLANTPPGHAGLVVLASDLKDTVGRDSAFDLGGADVLVIAFETDDPTAGVREFWEQRLRDANAGAVLFHDPMESPEDALAPLSHVRTP